MPITYEWCVEECSDTDILDPVFMNSYADSVAYESSNDECTRVNICLKVTKGNENDGITDWSYAYVIDGNLAEEATGDFTRKIPKRFQKEVGAFKNLTRHKTLDMIAADHRIKLIDHEPDEGRHFIRIDLADGYCIEGCSSRFEWSAYYVKYAATLIDPDLS